ncbi:MAG: hypothetical protein V4635_08055 [Bacteroidota bacterium]
MNAIKFVVLILSLCLLHSCKKEKATQEEVSVPKPFYYVQTMTDSLPFSVGFYRYYYDANGRSTETTCNGTEVLNIERSGDQLIYKTNPGLSTEQTYTYNLNNAGLLVSGTGKVYGRDQHLTFEYDENGYLVKQTTIFDSKVTVSTITIKSGNVSSINTSWGSSSDVTTFEYYPYTTNTIGNLNMGYNFRGKQSVNLLKSETKGSVVTNYTYVLDAKNRVIKKKVTTNNVTKGTTYTYY